MPETRDLIRTAEAFEFATRTYDTETATCTFTYRVYFADAEPLLFTETINLPPSSTTIHPTFATALLEDLHLVLGLSYYKLFCPPVFKTDIALSPEQATFWNTIYTKGLGEFLYRNKIPQERIAQFTPSYMYTRAVHEIPVDRNKLLAGIGGGKDSIVSLELLRDYVCEGFIVETGNEYDVARDVAKIAEVPLHTVRRALDPQLYAGVPQSYNGHVPISAVYAFLGVYAAALTGSAWVVVSNEYSSSFGSVDDEGREVNHQWSKSEEFERLFQSYVQNHLTPSIRYFSLLRPFYELRIVRMFVERGEKYFNTFSSCNRNFAHTHDGARWCGECPKCAFAFLMLSAFLSKEQVVGIFKKNLFEDKTLIPLFTDLLGFGGMKPFDCVGTFDESRAALMLAKERWGADNIPKELMVLMKDAEMPEEVLKVQQAKTVPTRFRMLGMESALILGYDKEGKPTETFLKKEYPTLRLGIADQKDGPRYLEQQHEYDIVLKTPGIPGHRVVRQYTTATHLFFARVPHTQIIGVTGSKGKSTTASLIYEFLKADKKKVRLVGNIGVPMLESLMETPIEPDELCVVELSSYQLEDLDVSPHLAVLTSLFPEHLDYHGSLEAYYDAKRNIIRFQNASDTFLYQQGFPLLAEWARTAQSEAITPDILPFEISNKALPGEHMHANVALAYTVGKMHGVSDTVMQEAAEVFPGLPHRLMFLGTYKGIAFYDDSISTTPESAIAGIHAVGNVDTIILGGVDRGYDFSELEKTLRNAGVRNIVLFPESGTHMLTSEDGFNVLHTESMDDAVRFAYEYTEKGKSCLLSPAAPSYNLFANFEERGQVYIDAVQTYSV